LLFYAISTPVQNDVHSVPSTYIDVVGGLFFFVFSTTDTKGQCFWRCPAYIAVPFHLVSEAEKQDIKGKEQNKHRQR
jgi:hypothetical protein